MPHLIFDDDPNKTPHILRNLETAPPRAIIQLQKEIGWGLQKIRDEIQGADFHGGILTAYLTVATAGRPVTWDYLMETPMKEWPWRMEATRAEREAAESEEAANGDDASDPPQPSPPASDPDDESAAEEWPPTVE